jgi:hypothetical protein
MDEKCELIQNDKLDALRGTIADMSDQIDEIEDEIESLKTKQIEMEEKINVLKTIEKSGKLSLCESSDHYKINPTDKDGKYLILIYETLECYGCYCDWLGFSLARPIDTTESISSFCEDSDHNNTDPINNDMLICLMCRDYPWHPDKWICSNCFEKLYKN